uniref:DSHCT domain-containing protein n=1 Tax=Macrostomum lignano TaxID=282301 RepID=A0A1I8IIV3_9PLAT
AAGHAQPRSGGTSTEHFEEVNNKLIFTDRRLLLKLPCKLLGALVSECGLPRELENSFCIDDDGTMRQLESTAEVPMSKVWKVALGWLQENYGDSFGAVFVSAMRWDQVGCGDIANKFDKVVASLGNRLDVDAIRAAASDAATGSPIQLPTPRDLSRCATAPDLVQLLVRCDRIGCLTGLCQDSEQAKAELAELERLMSELAPAAGSRS